MSENSENPKHPQPPDQQESQIPPAETSHESIWDKQISRRNALKILAATVGATVDGLLLKNFIDNQASNPTPASPGETPALSSNPLPNPEATKSPEVLSRGIEFGFNTHLDNEAQNMNLDLFKKCVEDLAANGQSWIRFNFKGSYAGDPQIMSDFDQGLDFAKQKGLKVALVTDPPDMSSPQAISDFYKGIAQRFKGKADVWQIFNEPNAHSYKDYSPRPKITEDYINNFSEAVAAASASIKRVDENAKTTINLSDWIGDHRDIEAEGDAFFGSVAASIDILTLDFYPDNPGSDAGRAEVAKYPGYISHFKQKFGKDVMVGEIGWPTIENGFTAQDQASYMQEVMSALAGGNDKPIAVLFYEWADEEGVSGVEGQFGVNNSYGTPKDQVSHDQLFQTMKPPKSSNISQAPQVI